jgi:hypothetical protein
LRANSDDAGSMLEWSGMSFGNFGDQWEATYGVIAPAACATSKTAHRGT